MNTRLCTVACVCGLAAGGTALLSGNPASASSHTAIASFDEATGTIQSVQEKDNTFILLVNELEVVMQVNRETIYTLDGEKSTMKAALKAQRNARVTHEEYIASQVDVFTE